MTNRREDSEAGLLSGLGSEGVVAGGEVNGDSEP